MIRARTVLVVCVVAVITLGGTSACRVGVQVHSSPGGVQTIETTPTTTASATTAP